MDGLGVAWSHVVHNRTSIVPDERRVGKTVLRLGTREPRGDSARGLGKRWGLVGTAPKNGYTDSGAWS